MKSENVELIKKLLQQEITSYDGGMFNEAGEVDWNFGRWYLASQLLDTIKMLEQREEKAKGKWEDVHVFEVKENMFDMAQSLKCSYCGRIFTEPYSHYVRYPNYCPYCGEK